MQRLKARSGSLLGWSIVAVVAIAAVVTTIVLLTKKSDSSKPDDSVRQSVAGNTSVAPEDRDPDLRDQAAATSPPPAEARIDPIGTAADTTQRTADDQPAPAPSPTPSPSPAPLPTCTFSDWKPVVFEWGGEGRHCFVTPGGRVRLTGDCDGGMGEGLFYRDIVGTTNCTGGDTQTTTQAARDEAARGIRGMDTGIDGDFATRFSTLLPMLIESVNNARGFMSSSSRVSWGTGNGVSPRDFIADLVTKHNLKQLAVRPCTIQNIPNARDLLLCQSTLPWE